MVRPKLDIVGRWTIDEYIEYFKYKAEHRPKCCKDCKYVKKGSIVYGDGYYCSIHEPSPFTGWETCDVTEYAEAGKRAKICPLPNYGPKQYAYERLIEYLIELKQLKGEK